MYQQQILNGIGRCMTWLMPLFKQVIFFSCCLGKETEVLLPTERMFPEMSSVCGWVCITYSSGCCLWDFSCLWKLEVSWAEGLERKRCSRQWFCHAVLESMLVEGEHIISTLAVKSVPVRSPSPWQLSGWIGITSPDLIPFYWLKILKLLQYLFLNLSPHTYEQFFYYCLSVDLYMRRPIFRHLSCLTDKDFEGSSGRSIQCQHYHVSYRLSQTDINDLIRNWGENNPDVLQRFQKYFSDFVFNSASWKWLAELRKDWVRKRKNFLAVILLL